MWVEIRKGPGPRSLYVPGDMFRVSGGMCIKRKIFTKSKDAVTKLHRCVTEIKAEFEHGCSSSKGATSEWCHRKMLPWIYIVSHVQRWARWGQVTWTMWLATFLLLLSTAHSKMPWNKSKSFTPTRHIFCVQHVKKKKKMTDCGLPTSQPSTASLTWALTAHSTHKPRRQEIHTRNNSNKTQVIPECRHVSGKLI